MTAPSLKDRIERARSVFSGPYNCTQAVTMAFPDIIKLEKGEILRLVSGFGYGIGGERSVCGALSGGVFVLSSTVKDPSSRDELYKQVNDLIRQFKEQNNGKLTCLDLVGKTPGQEEFGNICPALIETVVRLTDNLLRK